MLLIHVPRLTNRLGYTLNVIFRHILHSDFEITADINVFEKHEGAKLCYGRQPIGDSIFLRSTDILFQTTIVDQSPRCVDYNGLPGLFPVYNQASCVPFDLLPATFYCLSRYEEYLPHFTDEHDRFPATESIAYKEGFLKTAVVDRWALLLASIITERYPDQTFARRSYEVENTVDIDAAYCYRHKGIFRTLFGMGRDLVSKNNEGLFRKRMRVLLRREPDPFDTFDFIIDVNQQHAGMRLMFFPLMADYNVNDKPISYQNDEFRTLLKHLSDNARMGLHASYASADNTDLIAVESERLSSILHRPTKRNRYHFLRLRLPASYTALINEGILHDYTMGYADQPGFRAGTGSTYPFFDLESDSETPLMVHPFVAMDSTFYYYLKNTPEEAEIVYRQLIDETIAVGGTLSLLWHNQSLCEDFGWKGWSDLYKRVLDYADGKNRAT